MGFNKRQSSGGNTTVPDDALVLPPQAFVDLFNEYLLVIDNEGEVGTMDCSNKGIVVLSKLFDSTGPVEGTSSGTLLILLGYAIDEVGYVTTLSFVGNALNTESVDYILSGLNQGVTNGTIANIAILVLDLSGGTNSSPAGGVTNADYLALVMGGATVSINP